MFVSGSQTNTKGLERYLKDLSQNVVLEPGVFFFVCLFLFFFFQVSEASKQDAFSSHIFMSQPMEICPIHQFGSHEDVIEYCTVHISTGDTSRV